VATAERAALEWGEPPLQPGDPLIGCQAVLHETQWARGPSCTALAESHTASR
jgi:hypothetical protein